MQLLLLLLLLLLLFVSAVYKKIFFAKLRINRYITATVNLACYWHSDCSDCGDEAKRCEQEKQQVGGG